MIARQSVVNSSNTSSSNRFAVDVLKSSIVGSDFFARRLERMPMGRLSPWSTTTPPPFPCLGDVFGAEPFSSGYGEPCYLRSWYPTTAASLFPVTSGLSYDYPIETRAPLSEPRESDFVEYNIATWLWVYLAPALLLIGTCGNVLSLAVLRGCLSFRKSSVGFTLSVLAIVDTGVLYVPLLRQWVLSLTDFKLDLRHIGGSFGCKVHFFLSYFLSQLSSWTVIVVTVERTMFVAMPIVAKVFCSRSRIIMLWSAIALSLLALNSHFFLTAYYPIVVDPSSMVDDVIATDRLHHNYHQNNSISVALSTTDSSIPIVNTPRVGGVTEPLTSNTSTPDIEIFSVIMTCYMWPEYSWFLNGVWYWIDFAVLFVVPFLVVATGNFVIGYCVVRALQFRRRHQQRDHGTGNGTRDRATSSADKRPSHSSVANGNSSVGGGPRDRKSKTAGNGVGGGDKYSSAITSSTLMLMSVSVTFLVTTVPNVVYFLKVEEWLAAAAKDPDQVAGRRQEARVRLIYAVTNLLLYANNSINFLLYCLTGSRFRRAARDLFSRSGIKRPSTGGTGGIPAVGGGAIGGYGGVSTRAAGGRRVTAAAAARTPTSHARIGQGRGVGPVYSSMTVTE